MKIEDIREIAEEKNIPKHLIDKLLAKIELDENGNVVDELTAYASVINLSKDIDIVHTLHEYLSSRKEKE